MAKKKGRRRTPSSSIKANSSRNHDVKDAQSYHSKKPRRKRKQSPSEAAIVRKVSSSSRIPVAQSASKRSSRIPQHGRIPHKQSSAKPDFQSVIGPKEFQPPKIEGMALMPKFILTISTLIAAALVFFFIIVFFIANNALDKEIQNSGAIYTQNLATFTKTYIKTVYDPSFIESNLNKRNVAPELNKVYSSIKNFQLAEFPNFKTKIEANTYSFDKTLTMGFLDLKLIEDNPHYTALDMIQKDLSLAAVFYYRLYRQDDDGFKILSNAVNDNSIPAIYRIDKTAASFIAYCSRNHTSSSLNKSCKQALDFFYDKYELLIFTIQNNYHKQVKENYFKTFAKQNFRIKGIHIGRKSGLKSATESFITDNFSPRNLFSFPNKIADVRISEPESSIRQFITDFTINNVDNDGEDVEYKVIVEYDNKELEKSKSLLMISLIVLTLLAIVFGVGVSYFLGRAVTDPIMHLVETVKQIAQGNYKIRTQIRSKDELWVLGKTIDMMCSNLDSAKELALVFSKYKHDIDITEEVVVQLLPERIPEIPGIDIHAYYNPAKEVGGDYYDFIQIDDDHLGVIVADVSGKGLPGAMVMTMARTILRYEAVNSLSPKIVLSKSNRHVTRDIKRGMFVTAFYAVLNIKEMTLVCASAGHNPMYILREESQEIERINPNGIALGFDKGDIFEQTIKEENIKLEPGDRIILYTDGVIEAQKPDTEEQFGDDRLIGIISNNPGLTSKELTEKIEKAIIEHQGGFSVENQIDDITVVTFRYNLQ